MLSSPKELSFRASQFIFTDSSCSEREQERPTRCRGSRLNMIETVVTGTSAQLFFGNRPEIDHYLSGPVTSRFACGCGLVIPDSTVFVFIEPIAPLRVNWADIFSSNSSIVRNSRGSSNLEEGVKYIILGNRCVYKEKDNDGPACFPAGAKVRTDRGAIARVDALEVGDVIRGGKGASGGMILGWTHNAERYAQFRRVELVDGRVLEASDGHYVYSGDGNIIKMSDVHVGSTLETEEGRAASVKKVARVWRWGLYNPQTESGDIIVGGIRCTTYTTAVGVGVGHALLTPVRALFKVGMENILSLTQD